MTALVGVLGPVSTVTLVGAAALGGTALAAGPLHHRDVVGPTAGDLSTANPTSSCQTVAGQAPHVDVLPLSGITLRTRVSDSTGNELRASFDFRQRGAHHPLATAVGTPVRSGEVSSVTVLTAWPRLDVGVWGGPVPYGMGTRSPDSRSSSVAA